jgi:hypothetical protein
MNSAQYWMRCIPCTAQLKGLLQDLQKWYDGVYWRHQGRRAGVVSLTEVM